VEQSVNYRKLMDEMVDASAAPTTSPVLAILLVRAVEAMDDLLLMVGDLEDRDNRDGYGG
jgi:hypothetical protein